MKKLKKINLALGLLLSLITLFTAFCLHEWMVLVYLLMIPIPWILTKKPFFIFSYLIYSFIAVFLGGLCHMYRTTIWMDTLSHFMWGILSSFIAVYLLDKMNMYDEKKVWFNILFIFIFSLATSGFWEICEFIIDHVFHMDMQRNIQTGVLDTMKDIIVAFIGNILFLLWYGYEYISKSSGVIKYLIHNMNQE